MGRSESVLGWGVCVFAVPWHAPLDAWTAAEGGPGWRDPRPGPRLLVGPGAPVAWRMNPCCVSCQRPLADGPHVSAHAGADRKQLSRLALRLFVRLVTASFWMRQWRCGGCRLLSRSRETTHLRLPSPTGSFGGISCKSGRSV